MSITILKNPRYASNNHLDRTACPLADMHMDQISGCDTYCATCGARFGELCKYKSSDSTITGLDMDY